MLDTQIRVQVAAEPVKAHLPSKGDCATTPKARGDGAPDRHKISTSAQLRVNPVSTVVAVPPSESGERVNMRY